MTGWVMLGTTLVNIDSVVAVERGGTYYGPNGWNSILVTNGGARIEVHATQDDMIASLQKPVASGS